VVLSHDEARPTKHWLGTDNRVATRIARGLILDHEAYAAGAFSQATAGTSWGSQSTFNLAFSASTTASILILILGGHLKTGHRGLLQNRPTDVSPGQDSYTPPTGISAMIFSMMRKVARLSWADLVYTDRDRSGG
jgi:hypothetical protein